MKPSKTSDRTEDVTALLQVVGDLVAELHPDRRAPAEVTLDSTFEKDLGLDSLARVELISRVETAFMAALPERTFTEAETPRDLLRAVLGAEGSPVTLTLTEAAPQRRGGASAAPAEAQTLVGVLQWHVAHHPDRIHIQFYQDDGNGGSLTYAQLHDGAAKVASALLQRSLKPAEPVVLMLPTGKEYFFSFFGILMAGGIPVPIYPPARASQLEKHLQRHASIVDNCQAGILITVPEAIRVAQLLKSQVLNLRQILAVDELTAQESATPLPTLNAQNIAFLQYTSGSTGNPKGVVLTHANLLANIRAMGEAVDAGPDDVFVSWLPLYHDMGLIGAWLGSLYFASLYVVMPPLSFLARPERWLLAIHRYRGTLSASPNFGYEYCVHRIKDEALEGLDLSSWRAAFNGAEAVSPDTLEQFISRFASYGFSEKAMMPVYGLAESSVGLAFPPLQRGIVIDRIERATFTRSGVAKTADETDSHALRFASCGLPLRAHQIRVVDPAGHELPERREGRLEFSGPSSTSGYYRDAGKTEKLFDGEWLDTGDLAYIAEGELYVTGRIKDIIIRAGRNIYPDELEKAVGDLDGIRRGGVAVFGSIDAKTETERLIVLAETRRKDPEKLEELRREVNALATDLIGAPPDEVVMAPPGSVLKTSSGKIRRAASRELFEKGGIGQSKRSVPSQLLHLAVGSILPGFRRFLRYMKALAFAAHSWSIFMLLVPVVWLGVMLNPVFHLRWTVMRLCIRLFARATATPIRVNGTENLPKAGQACIFVANHASYLDGYALTALLPGRFRYVAKIELAKKPLIGPMLKRIRTEFVERFDIGKSVRDTEHLGKVLKAGHSLFFFPEGSFSRIPGLMPFHLGAFSVAAEAGAPIVPVAIRGTRSILRAGSWFPQHGAVTIEIGHPIDSAAVSEEARGDNWQRAIALRNQSREFILRHCGEPDLASERPLT
jgi:acyl carrier protein